MKYDIVLTPFLFDNFSQTKIRPALILSNKIGKYNHLVIAYITTQIETNIDDFDILINESDSHFSETGLRSNSVIKLHRLITIPEVVIKKSLGHLPLTLHQEVSKKIISLFSL
jgi:mRNA interferase MazF